MDEEHETVEAQRLALETAYWQRHAARRKRRQDVTRISIIAGVLLLAAFGAGWTMHGATANSGTSACEGVTNDFLVLTDEYGAGGGYETGGYVATIQRLYDSMQHYCPSPVATQHPLATYPVATFETCQQAYDAFIKAQPQVNVLAELATDQAQRELIQTVNATDAYRERHCDLP